MIINKTRVVKCPAGIVRVFAWIGPFFRMKIHAWCGQIDVLLLWIWSQFNSWLPNLSLELYKFSAEMTHISSILLKIQRPGFELVRNQFRRTPSRNCLEQCLWDLKKKKKKVNRYLLMFRVSQLRKVLEMRSIDNCSKLLDYIHASVENKYRSTCFIYTNSWKTLIQKNSACILIKRWFIVT